MSTTIRLLRGAGAVAAVLGAWAAIMLVLPFVGREGRQVAVLGDQASAVKAIARAGGRIVEVRRGAVLARADRPGFPGRLYAAGAVAVVEGRIAAGCFAKAPSKAGA